MKRNGYLIINSAGSMRITKSAPKLGPSEIALNLSISVPDRFFRRPTADIVIDVPDDAIAPTEAVVRLVANQVGDALHIEADDVEDGLTTILKESNHG